MFGRLIVLLMAYVSGKLNNHSVSPGQLMAQLSTDTIQKVSSSLLKVISSMIFLGLGLSTILADLILTSHNQSQLLLSSVAGVGGGLIVIALAIAATLSPKLQSKKLQTEAKTPPAPSQWGQISDSVSQLINDVIVERKQDRIDRRKNDSAQTSTSPTPRSFTPDSSNASTSKSNSSSHLASSEASSDVLIQ